MAQQKAKQKPHAETSLQGEGSEAKESNVIPVFGREEPGSSRLQDRSIGWFKKPADVTYGRGEVDAADLKKRIVSLLGSMQSLIDDAPEEAGKFSVESLTFSVEITAKGSVSLLGTGGEIGGRGGVTVTLKRSKGAARA